MVVCSMAGFDAVVKYHKVLSWCPGVLPVQQCPLGTVLPFHGTSGLASREKEACGVLFCMSVGESP